MLLPDNSDWPIKLPPVATQFLTVAVITTKQWGFYNTFITDKVT
jgi:hypothetical protein